MRVSAARFVERATERGLVRYGSRTDGSDADIGGDAVVGKSEAREELVVAWKSPVVRAPGHEAVKGPCRVGRRASTLPQRRGTRVCVRHDDRNDERLGEGSRDRVRIARGELPPLAVVADEGAKRVKGGLAPLFCATKCRRL